MYMYMFTWSTHFYAGGGLVLSQMMPGLVSDFQMWDRALNNSEIVNLECGAEGNLLDFNDFEIVGSQQFDQRSNFECTQ